jgi:hypothetical protein
MIDPKPAIPGWARGALRTVGIVNAVLLLIGTSFVVDSIYRFSTDKYRQPPDAPYFQTAFVVMLAIETVFLAILAVMAIRLMQARLSAINSLGISGHRLQPCYPDAVATGPGGAQCCCRHWNHYGWD